MIIYYGKRDENVFKIPTLCAVICSSIKLFLLMVASYVNCKYQKPNLNISHFSKIRN